MQQPRHLLCCGEYLGGNMLRKLLLAAAALAVLATPAATPAAAQGSAPIKIIVPVPAGASTDTIARALAEKLRESLGETVLVENKPGAGQRLGMVELMKAPADGRTLLIASSALYSIVPHIYGDQAGFDPEKDVLPVTRVVTVPVGLASGPQTGAANVAEFTAWAKANPAQASFGSPGAGSSSHFAGLMLGKAIGVPLTHIAYRGGAPALTDLIGGHIPLVSSAFSDMPALHNDGKLKVIAITSGKRSPILPDIKTLKEQGVNIEFDLGFDVHIKAGAPAGSVERLNKALVAAIKSPDVSAQFLKMGLVPAGSTPKELADWQAAEIKLWAEPVKESGFKGE
jgi:tripartite-type tricarboxylate transporter receptor subunit TctC